MNRVGCISDYHHRNIVFIKWLKENYQGYHDLVVFDLSAEQMSNRRVYFRAKQDLQYNILNPKFMQLLRRCFSPELFWDSSMVGTWRGEQWSGYSNIWDHEHNMTLAFGVHE